MQRLIPTIIREDRLLKERGAPSAVLAALAKVVEQTAFDIERGVKERMRAPKSGRTYQRGAITRRASRGTRKLGLRERTTKKGNRRATVGFKFHRASAPGEAPAVDLAAVINSIRTEARGLRASITANDIAALLEGGTVRMAARPAFGPELDAARAPFQLKIDEAIGG